MQDLRFRGGLVFEAFVSLNSRLESNKEEKKDLLREQGSGFRV